MKKRFVAVVEFEEDEDSPLDLSSLATWVEASLARANGVRSVDVTTYHSAEEAALDEAQEPSGCGLIVVGARRVKLDEETDQVCVLLTDGTERLLNTYLPKRIVLDVQAMKGKRLAQAHRGEY